MFSLLFQLSKVNLNNMLCPAVSDPFYGRLYRICAMIHQMFALPLVGKTYAVLSKYLGCKPNNDIVEKYVFGSTDKHTSERKPPEHSSNSSEHQELDIQNHSREQKTSLDLVTNASSQDKDTGTSERLKGRNGFVAEGDYIGGDHIAGHCAENGHIKKS